MYLEIEEGFLGHRKTLRFCSLMQSPEPCHGGCGREWLTVTVLLGNRRYCRGCLARETAPAAPVKVPVAKAAPKKRGR